MASSMGTATGPAKLKAVTALIAKLSTNLESANLSGKECNDALEELKIYGRDPQNSDPIFSKEGFKTLLDYGFNKSGDTARAAQRVVANAMLLKPETRQMFIDLGYETKACQALKSDHFDNQFLVTRIIFFSTYANTLNLQKLITEYHLADSIISNIAQHTKLLATKSAGSVDPMQEMALVEMLRLQFNITHMCANEVSSFNPSIQYIIPLLWQKDVPEKRPLDAPFGPLINALANLDFAVETAKAVLYPTDEPAKLVNRLAQLLNNGLREYEGVDLDLSVTPLVGVLTQLLLHAPDATKKIMQDKFLPSAEDRKVVLGRGDTLAARLLRSTTNPIAPKLGTAASHFLFDLSDRDGAKFVENVGYGYASGFLFPNVIPIPASAQDTVGSADGPGKQRAINPVTGQFLDEEKYVDTTPMTDEEKEREAERLFVLFERLKKTGVVDVQNPVEQAMREGKFRELDDDDVEELE